MLSRGVFGRAILLDESRNSHQRPCAAVIRTERGLRWGPPLAAVDTLGMGLSVCRGLVPCVA